MVVQAKPVHPTSRNPRTGAPAAATPRARRRDDSPHAPGRSRRPAPPASARPAQPPSARPSPVETNASRPDRGIRVVLVFVTAMLIMVAAVTLVGAVDQWWVLVPVMLVDFILTFVVVALFVELLGEGG
jgi:hypothetical protein